MSVSRTRRLGAGFAGLAVLTAACAGPSRHQATLPPVGRTSSTSPAPTHPTTVPRTARPSSAALATAGGSGGSAAAAMGLPGPSPAFAPGTPGPSPEQDSQALAACQHRYGANSSQCKALLARQQAQENGPVAYDGRDQVVTLAQAEAWWPYRPLLWAPAPPRGFATSFLAGSLSGGTRGQPGTHYPAWLDMVYQPPGTSVYRSNAGQILAAGGLFLQVEDPNLSQNQGPTGSVPVRVRGGTGYAYLMSSGTQASRFVGWWQVSRGAPAPLSWFVEASPAHYSTQELVSFADSLTAH
ncbi:MAG: hypothetical protein ACYDB7_01355 [Mycobacteriales bacterium]